MGYSYYTALIYGLRYDRETFLAHVGAMHMLDEKLDRYTCGFDDETLSIMWHREQYNTEYDFVYVGYCLADIEPRCEIASIAIQLPNIDEVLTEIREKLGLPVTAFDRQNVKLWLFTYCI